METNDLSIIIGRLEGKLDSVLIYIKSLTDNFEILRKRVTLLENEFASLKTEVELNMKEKDNTIGMWWALLCSIFSGVIVVVLVYLKII